MKVVLIGQYSVNDEGPMTGPARVLVNLRREYEKLPELDIEILYKNAQYPAWLQAFDFLKRLATVRADVIHLHGTANGMGWLSLIRHHVNGCKVIFTLHGLAAREKQMGYRYWPLVPLCEKILAKRADRVTTVSPAMQKLIANDHKISPLDIAVVPNGVDNVFYGDIEPSYFFKQLAISADEPVILFAGGTRRVKGLEWLLKTLTRCEAMAWTLVIAGSCGDQHNLILKLAAQFPASRVKVVDGLNQKMLATAYKVATLLVHPSFYEPFGMVPLEAMAAGAAVIVSDRVGMSYLIEDGVSGYIVPYGDSDALVDRIHLLLSDESKRVEMGYRARAVAQKCSWDNVAQRYVQLYKEALAL